MMLNTSMSMSTTTKIQLIVQELPNPHAKAVFFWFSALSLPVALLFNSLAFVIFTRKCFRQQQQQQSATMAFYYCWLLVFDTAIVLVGSVEYLITGSRHDPKLDSVAACRFFAFAIRFVGQCSSWFEVFLTADRFLSIVFPNRFKFNKKLSNLYWILLAIVVTLFAANLVSLWFTVQLVPVNTDDSAASANVTAAIFVFSCAGVTKDVHLARETFALLSLIILPVLIIGLLNVKLLHTVWKSKRNLKLAKTKNRPGDELIRKELQFASTVLSLTIIFVLFNIPLGVVSSIQNVYKYLDLAQSRQLRLTLENMYAWSRSLAMFYHALPFFINLRFNRLFRKQLSQLVSQRLTFKQRVSNNSSAKTAETT